MAYCRVVALALYRKYRPATFAEVVGQEHVTGPLQQALASGRINHAYLFSGPRGCGKTSSARIMARSLNCEKGPTPTPCGVCESCVALAPDGPGSLDVIEIDAASHGGVDDARDLRERAFFAPVSSRYKVYIIDEAHMVSPQGFNALLKLVEEPPEFLVFIFATTEPDKVLPTIRSRTHHYPFRLIPPGVLRGLLERICAEESVTVEPPVYPLVVRAGNGSARDAESVLDQLLAGAGPAGVQYANAVALLGVTDAALLDETVDALAAADGAAVFQAVDRVVEAGHDPRRFAGDLLDRLRDLLILDAVPDAVAKSLLDAPTDQLERMQDQAKRLGMATLSRLADIVHNGLVEMRGTTSPRLLLELVCARMLLPSVESDTAALLQRLERLERRADIVSTAPAAAPRTAAAEPESGGTAELVRETLRQRRSGSTGQAPPDSGAPAGSGSSTGSAGPTGSPTPGGAARSGGSNRPAGSSGSAGADDSGSAAPAGSGERPETAGPRGGEPVDAATGPPAPREPVAGAVDAAAVRRVWPEVLEVIKGRQRRTHALLHSAVVSTVDGNTLVLAMSTAPLARLLSDGNNTDHIRAALREILGVDWRIKVEVEDGSIGGAVATGGPPAAVREEDPRDEVSPDDPPPAPPAPVDPERAAISLLQSTLGAQHMDDSPS
jgi:DNA polymerase III subunit gamma/tau